MKNISTYVFISIVSFIMVVATAFLMTAGDAPIREAGGYLPLIFGGVFTWSTAKAGLMERTREEKSNIRMQFNPTHNIA